MKRKIGVFEVSIVSFIYILPLISIIADISVNKGANLSQIVLKWCIFWGVGFRLLTAGFKQALSPAFTAQSIFEVTDTKAFPIVRELGFANICSGLIAITSLFVLGFRLPAAVIGVLYYLLALLQHLVRKGKNKTEWFVTITNLSIVLELGIPLLITLL